jgi:hypothetical protein
MCYAAIHQVHNQRKIWEGTNDDDANGCATDNTNGNHKHKLLM